MVTPAPPRSRHGNRVTALRWARLLRELGHHVSVGQSYEGQRCDLLVALHARRSATSVNRFRQRYPKAPLVLALTGTDVYADIHHDSDALAALELADRYVVLQRLAVEELPVELRPRAHVIHQSAIAPEPRRPRRPRSQVAVLAHLRRVKEPEVAARAARLLPSSSKLKVVHVGASLDAELAEWAWAETEANPRYEWRGEVPHWRAMGLLAESRLMLVTSRAEGGANAVSEALAVSVPVLSSRIAGSVGILGPDYPGYFAVGDAEELAVLLSGAEADADFYGRLRAATDALRPLVSPARERQSWSELLASL